MVNRNNAMKNHLGNLSRAVGSDVTKKYNYILSQDDLINAYLTMKDELGYPLMIDSKNRRAVIYNKKGLEKKIQEIIIESIIAGIEGLEELFVNETLNDIISQLNSLVQATNGTIETKRMCGNAISKEMNYFIKSLSKSIVKGITTIVNEVTDDNDKK